MIMKMKMVKISYSKLLALHWYDLSNSSNKHNSSRRRGNTSNITIATLGVVVVIVIGVANSEDKSSPL